MFSAASLPYRYGLSSATWLSNPRETICFLLPRAYFSVIQSTCKLPPRKLQHDVSLCVVHGLGRIGLPAFALKKQGKGGIGLSELSDPDDEFDGFFDEDGGDVGDDDKDDDEEGIFLPLKNMKEWLERKPRGFGEGKEYNISIEDKLLEEMERSRLAQAANLNKLKNESAKPNSNKNVVETKAPEIVNTGVRIRIVNLPKKKNIHRDLMRAFQEFSGIINIIPAVVGNKKTRDPICKGFAFVDFKSEGDAMRFLQAFSRQYLMFGKIQKQIKCEMVNQPTSSSAHESSATITPDAFQLLPKDESEHVAYSDVDDCSLELWEVTAVDNSNDFADKIKRTRVGHIEENIASASELHSDDGDSAELRTKSKIWSLSQKELELEKIQESEKIHLLVKKPLSKGRNETPWKILPVGGKKKVSKKKQLKDKGEKKLVIEIPGSAKRLKIKEKAVLTDVYSRYGSKSALVSKGGN